MCNKNIDHGFWKCDCCGHSEASIKKLINTRTDSINKQLDEVIEILGEIYCEFSECQIKMDKSIDKLKQMRGDE